MGSSKSRRNFIKKSSAIGAGIFIVPRNVLGGTGYVSPSDQLNLAAIGSGGKGISDIANASVNGRKGLVLFVMLIFQEALQDQLKDFQKLNFFQITEKCLIPIKI